MTSLWQCRALGRFATLRGLARAVVRARWTDGRTYVIRRGPLRGLRWLYTKEQQFWFVMGAYESQTADWIESRLSPGRIFFDVGANFGYFTIAAARWLGDAGAVHAFEPLVENAKVIQRHVAEKRLGNVKVLTDALGEHEGLVGFVRESTNANSHLEKVEIRHAASRPAERAEVKMVTLDAYVRRTGARPDVVKIDVEGAELMVLKGADRVLRECRPKLVVSTHSSELEEACRLFLEDLGYSVRPLAGFGHELVAEPGTSVQTGGASAENAEGLKR